MSQIHCSEPVPFQVARTAISEVSQITSALGVDTTSCADPVPYTVVPGNHGPRWLLPNVPELTSHILREWRPYGASSRLRWQGIRFACGLGKLHLLPKTSSVLLPGGVGTDILRHIGLEG